MMNSLFEFEQFNIHEERVSETLKDVTEKSFVFSPSKQMWLKSKPSIG